MNREAIDIMIRTGVDIIELQIPFSDPLADGPFFTHANETSVQSGTKVNECFVFAREMTKKYPEQIFVFMTYGNIVYQCGIEQFVYDSAIIGIRGLIIPDLTIATPE
jgi:tryptophan synthase alpha chain